MPYFGVFWQVFVMCPPHIALWLIFDEHCGQRGVGSGYSEVYSKSLFQLFQLKK